MEAGVDRGPVGGASSAEPLESLHGEGRVGEGLGAVDEGVEPLEVADRGRVEGVADRGLLRAGVLPPRGLEVECIRSSTVSTTPSYDVLGAHGLDPRHGRGGAALDVGEVSAVAGPGAAELAGVHAKACTVLEGVIFQLLERLDESMTFVKADMEGPAKCIEKLKAIAAGLGDRSRAKLAPRLIEADEALKLRNGVVHGSYRKNYLYGDYESRRYARSRGDGEARTDPRPIRPRHSRARVDAGHQPGGDLLDYREPMGKELDVEPPWMPQVRQQVKGLIRPEELG